MVGIWDEGILKNSVHNSVAGILSSAADAANSVSNSVAIHIDFEPSNNTNDRASCTITGHRGERCENVIIEHTTVECRVI